MNRNIIFIITIIFIFIVFLGQVTRILTTLSVELDERAHTLKSVKPDIFSRKIIKDRNETILAIDIPSASLIINPSLMDNTTFFVLANELTLEPDKIKQFSNFKEKNSQYMKLADDIAPEQITVLQNNLMKKLNFTSKNELKNQGIYFENNYKRFYPLGEVTAQVVGITNSDNKGQFGIEKMLNDELDNNLNNLSLEELIQFDFFKQEITLTLDSLSQIIAYDELKKAVESTEAKRGAVIVINAKTGEILVNAVYPSFNPNNKKDLKYEDTKNIVFTEQLEPGSIIKPLIMAKYVDSSPFLVSSIDIGEKKYKIGTFEIKDTHVPKNILTLTEILKYSSNIGILQVSQKIGKENLVSFFEELGFGYKTVNFPDEKDGDIISFWDNEAKWLTSSYGYSIEITIAQLANAFQTLANNGLNIPLKLIKDNNIPYETTIFKKETSKKVLEMLKATVEDGTAKRAKIDGYEIGGKTGTVRKLVKGAYSDKNHQFFFVGLAPIDDPELITIIYIDNPSPKEVAGMNVEQSAGKIVAPVYANIMKQLFLINNSLPTISK